MKHTVNFSAFVDAFRTYDRYDHFGYDALYALFEYCEGLEEASGIEMELDVIGLCCDWTAYASAVDACAEYRTPVELTRTAYTAGWNMPGYMPDSEPAQFDEADDAREYIANNIVDYADSLADSTDDSAESVAALLAAAEQVRDSDGELGITVAGWHYWITAETVDNEDAEEQCLEWLQERTTVIEFDPPAGGVGGILVMAF